MTSLRIKPMARVIMALFVLAVFIAGGLVVRPFRVRAATTPAAASTIALPEIGASIPVSAEIADLAYLTDSKTVPGTTFLYVSSKSLQSVNSAAGQCTTTSGALGAIWKVSFDPTTVPEMARDTVKKLPSGAYLVYQPPQTACSADDTVTTRQTKLIGLVRAAVANGQQLQGSAQ